jgi:hypothetical protein
MCLAMLSILPHTHAFRCSRPGPASVYLASQSTVTEPVNTARISYLGCTLRTARLNDDCRPHPTTVAVAPHYPHTRPPDVPARLSVYQRILVNTYRTSVSCTNWRQNVSRASDAIRSGTRYAKWAGGLSLADTQTGRYGRLYSRRRLCARRGADARLLLRILVARTSPTGDWLNPILLYNWVLDTDTGTGPIPPITVSRVNAYSGGVLAIALSEGLEIEIDVYWYSI